MDLEYRQNALSRFWAKVEIGAPNDCWNWTAFVLRTGYGQFFDRESKTDRFRGKLAHRVAYEAVHGQIPSGLVACHRCDNRRCVNPSHIFLGTQRENVLDMIRKGRGRTRLGSTNNMARLDEAKVAVIRQRLRAGEHYRHIAKDYGVNVCTVHCIKQGKTWRHVA